MKIVLAALLMAVAGQAFAIPADAHKYRRDLIRNARLVWGLNAPIATFAGQIDAESRWQPTARSSVGAQGLSQFMPATAKWISGANSALSANEPNNPIWAIRALVEYDKMLFDGAVAYDECEQMAKALSGYNGGSGWVARMETVAATLGLNWLKWFDNVETVNAGRRADLQAENIAYPRKILKTLAPQYVAAGWGTSSC